MGTYPPLRKRPLKRTDWGVRSYQLSYYQVQGSRFWCFIYTLPKFTDCLILFVAFGQYLSTGAHSVDCLILFMILAQIMHHAQLILVLHLQDQRNQYILLCTISANALLIAILVAVFNPLSQFKWACTKLCKCFRDEPGRVIWSNTEPMYNTKRAQTTLVVKAFTGAHKVPEFNFSLLQFHLD